MFYIFYNPLSRGGEGKEIAEALSLNYQDKVMINVLDDINYEKFFSSLNTEDQIIICGGDGTLNHFLNDTKDMIYKNDILFFSAGSGNDFIKDLGKEDGKLIKINDYVEKLPKCIVNGKEIIFFNGVGAGLDGYCCKVACDKRKKENIKINYTLVAIKGLIYGYKRNDMTVTIDGKEIKYKKVWLLSAMKGKFYGGGMMITPSQDRFSENKELTMGILYNANKLKLLLLFKSIFKGKHVLYKDIFREIKFKNMHIKFNNMIPVQIDGEFIGETNYLEIII